MTRPGHPVLSAEDFARIVDTYSDRVHDAVRRLGVSDDAAAEIVLTSAADLVDAAASAEPATADPVGWWFARALALAQRLELGGGEAPAEPTAAMLRDTDEDAAIRESLDTLPEAARLAVMLRDAYDLPPVSVANVLGMDPERAAQVTAMGRLGLLSAYDGRQAPTLDGHVGKQPVSEGWLGLLADGGLDVDDAVVLRRHVARCPACEDMLTAQDRARRLAAGLPIVGLRDEDRDVVLPRLKERAAGVLPAYDEVLLTYEDDEDERPLVPPLVIVAVVAAALIGGIIAGLILSGDDSNKPGAVASPSPTASATPTPTLSSTPSATPTASPTASPTPSPTRSPTPSPTPSPTASPTPSPTPARDPTMTIDPNTGGTGDEILVTGSDWDPGNTLTVRYRRANQSSPGDATTTVVVEDDGTFTASVHVNEAPLTPAGLRAVTVRDPLTGDFRSRSFTYNGT